jgi:hypothetical protein
MIKTILIFSFVFFKTFIFSQENYKNYYSQISLASTEIASQNYSNAIAILDSTFNKYYPFTDDLKVLTKCYLAIGNTEKAYESMKRMILTGFKLESSLPLVKSNTALGNFKQTTGSGDSILESKLLNEYTSLREEYSKNIDWQLNNYLAILTFFEVHTSLMRKMCDSHKQDFIVSNYGFSSEKDMLINLLKSDLELKRALTDTWESNEFIVMLIHCSQSLSNQQETELFFGLLKKHVDLGNLNNIQYAMMIDNIRYRNKQGTLYGQQFQTNPKTGEKELSAIEDIKNVDIRRAELGLPPLWVWCVLHNLIIPKDYIRE